MAFDVFELSRFAARPVHLFVFTYGSLVLRYAASDRDIIIGTGESAVTYTAAAIQRSEIKQTTERAKDKITITAAYLRDPSAAQYPSTQPLGDLWHPYIPSGTVRVTCLATHVGDTDPPVVEWMGVVTQPRYSDTELELTCTPAADTDRARYQGAKWQRACWKTVYSSGLWGCNLDPAALPVPGTLTAVSGTDITAAAWAAPARSLSGGSAAWIVATARSGSVTAISSSVVTLDDVTGLAVGSSVSWSDGSTSYSATVTALDSLDVTLDDVTGIAAGTALAWSEDVLHTAAITAVAGSTLTLDDATGLAVGSTVIAYAPSLTVTATLTAVSGLTLTAAEFAAAPLNLAGGSLQWTTAAGIVERRSIMSHSGDSLGVLWSGADLAVGTNVIAKPGCPRTWAACAARGNTVNYGGAIYKPVENPLEGVSMSWG